MVATSDPSRLPGSAPSVLRRNITTTASPGRSGTRLATYRDRIPEGLHVAAD